MKAKTWKDISLDTFLKIQGIVESEDAYTRCNLIDTIYGVDSYNMPVSELKNYPLAFLEKAPEGERLKGGYTVEGRRYDTSFDLQVVQVNQFIDYQNYCKGGAPRYQDILSVFFIPKGHTYNDGYDMDRVKADMLRLPITIVIGMANFFEAQFQSFALISLTSFRQQGSQMKLSPKERTAYRRVMDAAIRGASSQSFSQLLMRLVSRGRA